METQERAPSPVPLGPSSLAWRHAGDNLQLLMAGTTLVLQVAHPVVGAGVGARSVFREDPWGRLRRTTEWGLRLLYGGPEAAVRAGRALREMHRPIRGVDGRGRSYDALDPEAYAWVHLTTYYAMVTTQRCFAERPFDAREAAQLYAEWRQQGGVLGIPDADMPHDVDAFDRYFARMIDERLKETDMVRYLLDVSMRSLKKPAELRWLPERAWRGLALAGSRITRLGTRGTMPPRLRALVKEPWEPSDARRFRRLCRVVRAALPGLPGRLRYLPPAYAALRGPR